MGSKLIPYSEITTENNQFPPLTSSRRGLFLQTDYFNRQVASEDNTGYNIVPYGYFTYRHMSDDLTFYFNINEIVEKGIVSTLYPVFTTTDELNSHFLRAYLNYSKRFASYCVLQKQGGSRTYMYFRKLCAHNAVIPSVKEQEKIADFIDLLDKRIKLQNEKIECLKKYKRGAVRALLSPKSCPLNGVKWTHAQIGELGKFIKGAPLSKADIASDGTPFILYGELYTTYNEVVTQVVRRTQANVELQYFSKIGDVVIPTSGETPEEISTASCIMLPGVILAGDLNIFRSDKIDGRIVSYILNHIVNGSVARVAQGKSIVHVQASEISKITIAYPDPETQLKLISIFDAISIRIAYSEKVLEQLRTQRKALLQQLFI